MSDNAKEMLKIQKQMEQKEKNRPIHSDCTDCLATKKFLEERIKVLGGKQNG